VSPVLSDVRPEGGYQDPWQHETLYSKLSSWKETPRCMFPGEFSAIVACNLNARWTSGGIASTRFGAADRKFAGLDPHGTVWFANQNEREWDISIPADCIPYTTIKNATWNESSGRWNPDGTIKRGWRSALEQLLENGHLAPSHELSWLIGRDSWAITPVWFGGWKPKQGFEGPSTHELFTEAISKYLEQPDTVAYGNDAGEVAVAKHDYREIEKEVHDYA
jgi:hypothetical protein